MGHNDVFRGSFRTGLDTVRVGSVALISFFLLGFEGQDLLYRLPRYANMFHDLINGSKRGEIIFGVQRAQL
jgi:hypothetical protein